jgi:hypothetical protein
MGWSRFLQVVVVAAVVRGAGGFNPGGSAGGHPCPHNRPPGGRPTGAAARPPGRPK